MSLSLSPAGVPTATWRSDRDMNKRREMIHYISSCLLQNASGPEGKKVLAKMVQQLEVNLYLMAPSLEAYTDTSTIKERLQLLAIDVAKKLAPFDIVDASTTEDNADGEIAAIAEKSIKKMQERLLILHHASRCSHPYGRCPLEGNCTEFQCLLLHFHTCIGTSCTWPHCQSSKKVLAHFASCKDAQCEACRPLRQKILSGDGDKTALV